MFHSKATKNNTQTFSTYTVGGSSGQMYKACGALRACKAFVIFSLLGSRPLLGPAQEIGYHGRGASEQDGSRGGGRDGQLAAHHIVYTHRAAWAMTEGLILAMKLIQPRLIHSTMRRGVLFSDLYGTGPIRVSPNPQYHPPSREITAFHTGYPPPWTLRCAAWLGRAMTS